METLTEIIETLKKSVEKNGEVPLTNKHLLNILLMTERNIELSERNSDMHWPLDD